jgi:hypothetical protein
VGGVEDAQPLRLARDPGQLGGRPDGRVEQGQAVRNGRVVGAQAALDDEAVEEPERGQPLQEGRAAQARPCQLGQVGGDVLRRGGARPQAPLSAVLEVALDGARVGVERGRREAGRGLMEQPVAGRDELAAERQAVPADLTARRLRQAGPPGRAVNST